MMSFNPGGALPKAVEAGADSPETGITYPITEAFLAVTGGHPLNEDALGAGIG